MNEHPVSQDYATDYIVSEMLSELKAENARKDKQIHSLYNTIAVGIISVLITVACIVGGFLWYLNQYDFSGTTTTEYHTVQTAEGVYAVIDSNGNVVGQDLSTMQLQKLLEELTYGEGDSTESN